MNLLLNNLPLDIHGETGRRKTDHVRRQAKNEALSPTNLSTFSAACGEDDRNLSQYVS